MKTFACHCGNTLHFESHQCLNCGRMLGFLHEFRVLSALEPAPEDQCRPLSPRARGALYRRCRNYAEEQVCNWMVPVDDPQPYCHSCRLNHVIPNLSEAANRRYWYRIEKAKRRLLYTLLELRLPVIGKDRDPRRGLAFEFLAERVGAPEFADQVGARQRVFTGHRSGTITINIAEADPSAREEMREKMNEAYRTLLGHFRHEIGHYYWMHLLAAQPAWLQRARSLFGDERSDYDDALKHYYGSDLSTDWSERHISAYASAHPWEDWAETWAHYLHMVDTLETARDMGFTVDGRPVLHPKQLLREGAQGGPTDNWVSEFSDLLHDWVQLTITMNALNRSMGLPDAYPFVLSETVVDKLRFVHDLIAASVPA